MLAVLFATLLAVGDAQGSARPGNSPAYTLGAAWQPQLGPLRRHLRTARPAAARHHTPRLLGQLPNNYEGAEHATIRVRNGCSDQAIEVAVMLWYNEWGDPENCQYRATWFDGSTRFCIDYWHVIQPGETAYLADTAYNAWYYAAHSAVNPRAGWGGAEYRNLQWQSCSKNQPGCYAWDKVEVGALEGGEEAGIPTLSCPTVDTDVTPLHLWDVWYNWPSVPDAAAPFEAAATIAVLRDPPDPSHYFFAQFLEFSDKRPAAAGVELPDAAVAYLGLQTWGSERRGAVFNVWGGAAGAPDPGLAAQTDGVGRPSGRCRGFDNEGSGWQCFASLDWEAGVPYRFTLSLLRREAGGDTFRAELAGSLRGRDVRLVVGDIFVPAFYGSPVSSVYFYEYYAPLKSCADLPPAEAQFSELALRSGSELLEPRLAWATIPTDSPCAGYASLSICGTTVSGASPLERPIDPASAAELARQC